MDKMKVVCIGDSLTYGYGVSNKENWISFINKKNKLNFINKGINGDTTGGMLSRFYRDVIDDKPQYVLIMGGTNDFITGNSLGAVQANIMAMVHQAYHNKIIPIIGTSIKADVENIREDWKAIADFKEVDFKMAEYNKWLNKFCSVFKIADIDFCTEFKNRTSSKYSSFFIDGLHPTKEGHEIIADIVYDFIMR